MGDDLCGAVACPVWQAAWVCVALAALGLFLWEGAALAGGGRGHQVGPMQLGAFLRESAALSGWGPFPP